MPPTPPIALDATYSAGDHLSGVGVYSRELLHGLAACAPAQRFLWSYRPHRFLRSFRTALPSNCGRRLLLESHIPSCGLFHGLNQRLPLARARVNVVTFHDLFVMTGEYSTPEFRARFTAQARDAASRADVIVCVSGFTASQVEDLLKVPASRLRTVWHGVHLPDSEPPADSDREQVVLHVGAIQARKNIVRLVEAFETLPPPWRLLLAGSQGYGSEVVLARIAASGSRDRITVTGYVDDVALGRLYRKAYVLAFPSLDEGFGIPLLESMAHGLPVLTSNGSALKEVAGGCGLLVDPLRVDEIADGLHRLTTDSELRRELIDAGLARAAENTWQVAAKRTWQVYRELLA